MDKKVLIIDMDQQMNISNLHLKSHDVDECGSIFDVLYENAEPDKVISKSLYENTYIIPAREDLGKLEVFLGEKKGNKPARTNVLKQWLVANRRVLEDEYNIDVVLIDTHPAIGIIEQNAFNAADTLLIVVSPSRQAIEGLKPFTKYLSAPISRKAALILYNEFEPPE